MTKSRLTYKATKSICPSKVHKTHFVLLTS